MGNLKTSKTNVQIEPKTNVQIESKSKNTIDSKKIFNNQKLWEFIERTKYQEFLVKDTGDKSYENIVGSLNAFLYEDIDSINEKIVEYLKQIIKLNGIGDDNIKNIIKNESTTSVIYEKIYKKIDEHERDKSKHNLEFLKIIVVGRKKIGKTDLIKYILKLPENENYNKNENEDFKEYTSNNVPYLKLVEYKGIGFDKDSKPEIIGGNISKYIDSLQKKNSNDLIHCIWYCITGTRFEEQEAEVLRKLKNSYKNDNVLPVIVVYTKTKDNKIAEKMKDHIKDQDINTLFVKTCANGFKMMNGKEVKAFGGEQLLKATLEKCTKSLQGDLINLMISNISEDVKNELLEENKKIKDDIPEKIENNFVENFGNVLNDGEFIDYIINIIMENLKYFYGKNISNKTFNLLNDSSFIKEIKYLIEKYKSKTKNIINKIIEEKSSEYLNFQAQAEKSNGNTHIKNKRTLNDYKKLIEISLKKNSYYISQRLIIAYIIQEIYKKFFEEYTEHLNIIIKDLLNVNNKNSVTDIKSHLEHCFLVKLKDFGNKWEININVQHPPPEGSDIDLPDKNDVEFAKLVKSSNNDLNTNSFIFNENTSDNDESNDVLDDVKNENNDVWFPYQGKEWKYKKGDKFEEKLRQFLQNLEVQDSFFNKESDDKIFVSLRNDIKKDLIDFLNQKKYDFMRNIHSRYSKDIFPLDKDIIPKIIEKEKISSIYLDKIKNEFDIIDNNMNITNIKYITIIVVGRSGVGKSSLINALIKEKEAKTDVGFFCTLKNDQYKGKNSFSFLNFIDTRGTQLDQINLENIVKNAKEVINYMTKEAEKDEDYNINVQCIYYCLEGENLEESEKKAILDLHNNKEKIPLIVVYTQAIDKMEVEKMKDKIENELRVPFINVLSEEMEGVNSYGLNDLIKLTLKKCKENNEGIIYKSIEKIISQSIKENLEKENADIKYKICEKLFQNFLNFNKKVNEKDLYETIFNYIKIFFVEYMAFKDNGKKALNQESKMELNNSKILNDFIQTYIEFYQNQSEKMIKPLLEDKSLKYLDMQAKKEKKLDKSINQENKNDREDFKKIISEFLCLNFNYISQKYLIYRFILDISETFSENLEKRMNEIVYKNMKTEKTKGLIKGSFDKIYEFFINAIYQPFHNKNIYEEDFIIDNDNNNKENQTEEEKNSDSFYPSFD